jgi:alanine-glyoxylate transaminase/serine-glyoxylate transaminase/serine-pyruvate transaminase
MKAYESGSAAYFATPPVNLIYAFHASLSLITAKPSASPDPATRLLSSLTFVYYSDLNLSALPSVNERFALHRTASQRIKSAAKGLGLKQVPLQDAEAANGMTALYFPEGVSAGDLLPRLGAKDVVVAGGLLGSIKGIPPHLFCRRRSSSDIGLFIRQIF